jgi:hypothetical protein
MTSFLKCDSSLTAQAHLIFNPVLPITVGRALSYLSQVSVIWILEYLAHCTGLT